jgi:type I restriction enzyme S subunit
MGQAPGGDTYNSKGNGLALIAGAADLGDRTPDPKKWTTEPTKIGLQGDIIVCVRATIGDLNWADKSYCYGRGVAGIRVCNEYDSEFVWYWLEVCRAHLLGLGRGATFKQISKEDLSSLQIPALPKCDQRRIVSRIKECMERVEEIEILKRESLQEAVAVLPSVLNEVFASQARQASLMTIGEVALETRYGTSQKCHSNQKGLAILRIPNVAKGAINLNDLKYCDLTDNEAARICLKPGDLLFVRTNGSRDLVGRCAVFDLTEQEPKFGFASYLIRVRVDQSKVLPRYLAYFLNSTNGRSELDSRRRTSAGQFNINSENLRSIPLPVPSIQVQLGLLAQLQQRELQANQLVSELVSVNTQSDGLREAILRKAFAGEL